MKTNSSAVYMHVVKIDTIIYKLHEELTESGG